MKYPYVVFEMNGMTFLGLIMEMELTGVQVNELLTYKYQKEIKKLFPKAKKVIPRIRLPQDHIMQKVCKCNITGLLVKEVLFRFSKTKTIKIDNIKRKGVI